MKPSACAIRIEGVRICRRMGHHRADTTASAVWAPCTHSQPDVHIQALSVKPIRIDLTIISSLVPKSKRAVWIAIQETALVVLLFAPSTTPNGRFLATTTSICVSPYWSLSRARLRPSGTYAISPSQTVKERQA